MEGSEHGDITAADQWCSPRRHQRHESRGDANPGTPFDECRVGLDHLSWSVHGREQLDAWLERLDERGIPHSGISDHESSYSYWIAPPTTGDTTMTTTLDLVEFLSCRPGDGPHALARSAACCWRRPSGGSMARRPTMDQGVRSRKAAGVVPLQRLKARVNAV